MLTQARLKELLHYEPDTGVFTWLVSNSNRAPVGSTTGCVHHTGYVEVGIDQNAYLAHRLAWLYVHGEFPPDKIDHINRVRTDNRLCNLRLATQSENNQNTSIQRRNNSGHIGVRWNKLAQKWRAQITLNRKQTHLGSFTDLNEAIAARKAAEKKYHQFQNP